MSYIIYMLYIIVYIKCIYYSYVIYYLYVIYYYIISGRLLTTDWPCDCCGTLRKKRSKDFWEWNPKKGSPPKVEYSYWFHLMERC